MARPAIETIIKTQEHMATRRVNFDSLRQACKELYWPDGADLTVSRTPGNAGSQHVYVSPGVISLERFSAIWQSLTTPQNSRWHTVKASVEELNEYPEVKEYFSDITKLLFRARNSPAAKFYAQQEVDAKSLGCAGDACLRVQPAKSGHGLSYQSTHVGDVWIAVDDEGNPDTIYHKRPLTAYKAVSMWGDRAPRCAKRSIEKGELMEEHEYLHVVQPRDLKTYDPDRLDAKGRRYESWEISMEDKEPIVTEGGDESDGYFEQPYIYSRFTVNSQEEYGRGPAMWTLPANLTLQSMKRSHIKQGEKAHAPPLLSHAMQLKGDGRGTFNMRSNAMNPGWLDSNGNPRVRPFENGFKHDMGREMMEDERNTLRDAHLVTLFQILVDNPQMTATEALIRAREKGALIGPPIGRQQSERLGPMIMRELGILDRQGVLPPPPPVLVEAGDELVIEYESEATTMQREAEMTRVRVWFEDLELIKQTTGDPTVGLVADGHASARWLGDARGIPTEIVASKKDVEGQMEAMAEAAQAAREAEQLPGEARAAKDYAQAGAA